MIKMKRRSPGGIAALILTICMLLAGTVFGTGAVYAEETEKTGSVEITVADFAEGTLLRAVEAAVYTNGKYVLNESFGDVSVDLTGLESASKAQAAAEVLAETAKNLTPADEQSVGADGKAVFPALEAENKLYVFFQISNEEVVKISPMLMVLPYYDDNDNAVYSVQIDAKYEDTRVKEYYGAIILNKADENKKPVAGAEFRVERRRYLEDVSDTTESTETFYDDAVGAYYTWEVVAETLTSDKNGQVVIMDLPLGIYRFTETKAPTGYILSDEPMEIVLDKEGTVKLDGDFYVRDEGEAAVVIFENKRITIESSEPSEPSEPSMPKPSEPPAKTGEDITKFIVIGCVVGVSLIVVVILVVISSKKKK